MESLVSRISSQRPACEMDYHHHYRAIENQHRLLLDAAERINSSSGDAGSGEDSTRARGSQARAGTPSRMIRAYSFDRGTQARRREGSAERKAKANVPGELKALKKLNHRPFSPSPSSSSSFSSLQPARSSKIISKTGRSTQDTSERQDVAGRQLAGDGGTAMKDPSSICELTGSRTVLRAKGELDRAVPDTQPSGTRPASRHGSLWSDAKRDALDAVSFSGETNLNSTFSSSCDFYPGGHEEPESPRHATREDLKLAIRPDSQSTTAGGDHVTNDSNQNDWDSTYNDLDFPQNGCADVEEPARGHLDPAEGTPHSVSPADQTKAVACEEVIDAKEDGRTDDSRGRNEAGEAHPTQPLTASTPVQNMCGDDGAAAATITSPKPLKVSINP